MDLEQLDKSQIVLLTMLVSFVTSIATGIVTVSLIEEAPTDVTRVVQRVVERTVEKVSPAEQQATVITQEKTVIVKESDLVAAAIADNKPRVVSVIDVSTKGFVALGVFIDDKGTLATDAQVLDASKDYAVDTGAEELLPATIKYAGGARGIALLHVDAERIGVSPITTSEAALQLGQTVIAFIGSGSIAQGIVTELGEGGYVGTSVASTNIAPGAPLINADGHVVGMSTGASREVATSTFASIRAAYAQATDATTPDTETPVESATSSTAAGATQ